MVSSGAFILREWRPQARINLERNPHFYGADTVSLDGVTFYPIDDIGSASTAFVPATWISPTPACPPRVSTG